MRIPPFSLVSPGCCTLVCTPTGVYKKEGPPRSSHYFAFQKILSTIYVYGDGNTACILIRNLNQKVSTSATLIKDSKVKLSNQGLTTFNVQQVVFLFCFPSYPERGITG